MTAPVTQAFRVALIGNPNAGKTTVFNALCGARQQTGNYAGVTVEKKTGRLRGHENVEIIDLPGTYSLKPKSADEEI
ncbi:MAG TPA: FeoB small GTPase domain-containing protein, partial [Turneriella sp.]|nr:FeoB small GTPase domain-containing protein [Turneriella sp.]